MSVTLYRKYRPKNFAEIIGQKHIVRTLSNAVKNNRVGQAYLFAGPRGTGKTSIARILAKTVNCQKSDGMTTCEKCPACEMINSGKALDIIEIDAASNTSVDNIRELRETIAFPPTSLKYKVYIIDEVHMLSKGAFNALLKTLEEPPSHVIFILATTEIHKVPETIISRCQRFDFARLPMPSIIEKLSFIAGKEKIKIDNDSLEMIAIAAEGGMRDAESLLAQIIALEDKNITKKEVEEILGTTDRKFSFEMAEMIIEGESRRAIEKINELLVEGYDLQVFNKSLINYLRQLMLLKISPELKSYFTYELTAEQLEKMIAQSKKVEMPKIIDAINLFLDAQDKISAFLLPQLPLEIAIIKATGTFPAEQEISSKLKVQSSKPQLKVQNFQKDMQSNIAEKINENIGSPDAEPGITNSELSVEAINAKWSQFLEEIRPHNHSLRVLLSNCRIVGIKSNEITLATSYDFYKERLNDINNKLTIEQTLGRILGQKIIMRFITNKEAGLSPAGADSGKTPERKSSLLQSALEILGGKVVEE